MQKGFKFQVFRWKVSGTIHFIDLKKVKKKKKKTKKKISHDNIKNCFTQHAILRLKERFPAMTLQDAYKDIEKNFPALRYTRNASFVVPGNVTDYVLSLEGKVKTLYTDRSVLDLPTAIPSTVSNLERKFKQYSK